MTEVARPVIEEARQRALTALASMELAAIEAEEPFEALVRVAAWACDAPLALVTLAESDRLWYLSCAGEGELAPTPGALGFFAHAMLADDLLEVTDATADARFAALRMQLRGEPLRLAAGAPLRLDDRVRFGALCVFDVRARALDAGQRTALQRLARAVAHAFEARRARQLERASRGAPPRVGAPGRRDADAALAQVDSRYRDVAAELAAQHEMLRVTLQSIGDGVITTDERGRIRWLNPVAERMTGWAVYEAEGQPMARVFHILDETTRQASESPVAVCLREGRIVGLAHHTLLVSRDGVEYGIEDSVAPIRSADGDILGAVLVFHDVTEQRRLSGEMSYRATHDALTGLVNRSEFEARLRRVLESSQAEGSAHALIYVDLDQFKLVNDACGHSIGDQVLQQASKLLADSVRANDTLARLGGDEFAIILEHCAMEPAQRLAQQICDRMDDFRFVHDARRFRIGASIGLVPVNAGWPNTAAIMQAADSACYAAKESGRNRVHVWVETDRVLHDRRGEMQWATRLEQALDEGTRFTLHAQRIVPLAPGEAGVHAEVLLRMIDDAGPLILPGAFLPAAERFNLASRIDRWVLRHAVEWLQREAQRLDLATLCVNLSGQSIGDRVFHRDAIEIIRGGGPGVGSRLCLEITETAAVTNLTDAADFIERVRDLGVRVALDDFGAGASSFGYLKSLPVDYLKIDGQFIQGMIDDPLDEAAVRCFIDVAKVVGVRTVAEFVDRPQILERLRAIGVDYAQGYLVHRPGPIAELGRLAPPTLQ